jgi:hypothetical protein
MFENTIILCILKISPSQKILLKRIMYYIEISKKIEKLIKSRKPNREKKPIKILKKSTGSVQFWFYKPETEPNPNRKNPSQTGLFEPISIFLKFSLVTFFIYKKRIK